MNTLQKLIDEKLKKGESYRSIGRATGIEHKSILNYHLKKTEPRGKNLAALARYFNVHFADLLDDYIPHHGELSEKKKELLDAVADATDDEIQAVLLLLRRHRTID